MVPLLAPKHENMNDNSSVPFMSPESNHDKSDPGNDSLSSPTHSSPSVGDSSSCTQSSHSTADADTANTSGESEEGTNTKGPDESKSSQARYGLGITIPNTTPAPEPMAMDGGILTPLTASRKRTRMMRDVNVEKFQSVDDWHAETEWLVKKIDEFSELRQLPFEPAPHITQMSVMQFLTMLPRGNPDYRRVSDGWTWQREKILILYMFWRSRYVNTEGTVADSLIQEAVMFLMHVGVMRDESLVNGTNSVKTKWRNLYVRHRQLQALLVLGVKYNSTTYRFERCRRWEEVRETYHFTPAKHLATYFGFEAMSALFPLNVAYVLFPSMGTNQGPIETTYAEMYKRGSRFEHPARPHERAVVTPSGEIKLTITLVGPLAEKFQKATVDERIRLMAATVGDNRHLTFARNNMVIMTDEESAKLTACAAACPAPVRFGDPGKGFVRAPQGEPRRRAPPRVALRELPGMSTFEVSKPAPQDVSAPAAAPEESTPADANMPEEKPVASSPAPTIVVAKEEADSQQAHHGASGRGEAGPCIVVARRDTDFVPESRADAYAMKQRPVHWLAPAPGPDMPPDVPALYNQAPVRAPYGRPSMAMGHGHTVYYGPYVREAPYRHPMVMSPIPGASSPPERQARGFPMNSARGRDMRRPSGMHAPMSPGDYGRVPYYAGPRVPVPVPVPAPDEVYEMRPPMRDAGGAQGGYYYDRF